jgi:hypothetical protein
VASSPQAPPRRVPPERALPEPTVGASQAIAAGTVSGALGTVAGAAVLAQGVRAPVAPVLAALKLGSKAAALAAILEALRGFRVAAAAREDAWIVAALQKVEGVNQQDVLDVVADERARRAEFDRKQQARLVRDVTRVLDLPEEERLPALRKVLTREAVYSGQRGEAVAIRSTALAQRKTLRRESPSGAYWVFQDDERTTMDCRLMGGKFWPWEALAILHPPTHTGCRCELRSYEWAKARGLVKPGDLIDVDKAVRLARAAKAHLHESVGVIEQGAVTGPREVAP